MGDVLLRAAPCHAGREAPAAVAFLPITFQAGAAGYAAFDLASEDGTPVAALLEAMNAYLDSAATERLLVPVDPVSGTPPDVRFGSVQDDWEECAFTDEDGNGDPGMRLAVGAPPESGPGERRHASTTAARTSSSS